ncbi:subtilisin-like serine protease-like protein PR1A [Calycina marina]|uniref:Subtilisin-like serine protease-like protein PR1A n=1 Tax=Calycina marina TaxID=1763456 RepID=A0A9P8CH62_9HELO|nr:subtilisin-like serine protease-like protein PR1A [Calycina marina]
MVSYLARLAGVAALALPAVFGAPAPGAHLKIRNADIKEFVPNKYIVVYETDVAKETIESHFATVESLLSKRKRSFADGGIGAKYEIGDFKGYAVTADEATIADIAATPEVAYIELDGIVYAQYIHDEVSQSTKEKRALTSQTGGPWGLGRISHQSLITTPYIYDSTAGSGVTVFVVDTGILITHTQFGGRATWGANFVDSSNTDGNGHGTHCAGTVAGSTYGVAKAANLVAVKVLDSSGSGTTAGVISGIQWVATNKATKSVLSMSLGGSLSTALNSAVRSTIAAGVTVVVAAGNSNADASTSSPASETLAITVGASDESDARASFSNYGSVVDVFAPGVGVLSSWIGSNTATNTISGTSMATPHIAGLAAYLITLEGWTTPAAIQARIKALATAGKPSNSLSVNAGLAYNGNGA